MKVKRFKLGKVSGRKSFELGDKPLLKKEPKGSLIGEGTIKVKIFAGKKGGSKIHMPKSAKLHMTRGKYMASKEDMRKFLKK
jgi:hypothetical protein